LEPVPIVMPRVKTSLRATPSFDSTTTPGMSRSMSSALIGVNFDMSSSLRTE